MCADVCGKWLLIVVFAGVFFAPAASLQAQTTDPESYLRLHYEKREAMVPMRDGVKLHTAIFMPRERTKTYPILMKRTPYGCAPYGPDKYPTAVGPCWKFVEAGYIFVNQDVRGRFLSEGEFQHLTPHIEQKSGPDDVDESTDTWDTIDWLLKNVEGNNGNVGMAGISYPGFYSAAGMINAHPALKAVSPQAPAADWFFDDFFHHGTFFLAHAYRWISSNARERTGPTTERPANEPLPSIDGYNLFLKAGPIEAINSKLLKGDVPFWKEMMQHPNRDEFWQKRDILPHLKNVAPQVMVVTGWYDAEDLYGSFETYRAIEKQDPKANNVLVVGPWIHGGWSRTDGDQLGDISFGSRTTPFYQAEIELPFFEKYLKGRDLPALQEATVFETGSNTWRSFDDWPPRTSEVRSLYPGANGTLTFEATAKNTDASLPEPGDEYISDPARPVPSAEKITTSMPVEYMTADQRPASRRPDVLVYETEPLTEDLVVAGPIPVDLWFTTTGTDADFIVKLIDVFPDGQIAEELPNYQMLLRSEAFRARFHASYEHPQALIPGKPTRIQFPLLDVMHRFRKGHRIMVQIHSTWFPLIDRNPQTFVPNIFYAKAEDFQKATHRILRSADHPTRLQFSVVPPGAK